MATVVERLDELRQRLGQNQAWFCEVLGLSRNAYANWRSKNAPDRDTLTAIGDRWLVSIDSLLARPGTTAIEPAPALRAAQELLVDEVARGVDVGPTTADRLQWLYRRLSDLIPNLTLDGWCDWLLLESDSWWALAGGHRQPQVGQLDGAAFVAGWHLLHEAWITWLDTGDAALLRGANEQTLERLRLLTTRAGLGYTDYLRLIEKK